MFRRLYPAILLLAVLTIGCSSTQETSEKSAPAKAGETVGSTSRKVVKTTKEVAGDIGEGAKEAGKSVWGAMKDFGSNVKEGWKEGTDSKKAE